MAEPIRPSDAEKVAESTGLSGRTAAWVAFAALHAGLFTKPQIRTWLKRPTADADRAESARLVTQLLSLKFATALEFDGIEVIHIHGKAIYRALGEPDNRNRRKPSREKALERLLALDYVLDHPDDHWLPTERAKTDALHAAGIPKDAWSSTDYVARDSGAATTRTFVEKWPMAIDPVGKKARLTCVSPGSTDYRIRNWLRDWEPLVRAFGADGFSVRLVHITFRQPLAEKAEKLLARAAASFGTEAEDRDVATIRRIQAAARTNTDEAYAPFGGFQEALKTAREIYARRGKGFEKNSPRPVEVTTEAWTSDRIQPASEKAK